MDIVNRASLTLVVVSGCVGMANAFWPTAFKQNAQTLPSIEIKLAPPEDPLPQITSEISVLEKSRMKLEEGMMAKLEDAYNVQLDNAQVEILAAVDRATSVFDSPDVLSGILKAAVLPIRSETETLISNEGSFEKQNLAQQAATAITAPMFRQKDDSKQKRKNGPLAAKGPSIASSFLQMKESSKVGGVIGDILSPPPSVRVMLTGIKEPDSKIKEKMEEIEQLRSDEEAAFVEQAITEFQQLTEITILELEKNIQIQMNPFLVDSVAIGTEVERALPQRNILSKMIAFREVEHEGSSFLDKKCQQLKSKYEDFKVECGSSANDHQKNPQTSFLEMKESVKNEQKAQFLPSFEKQLNVRLAQSDRPYPTIDELVHDMQKRRDATERLERMKVLELQLKLLKAQDEMIKDALHTSLARVMAQYGPAVEGIKAEIAVKEIS